MKKLIIMLTLLIIFISLSSCDNSELKQKTSELESQMVVLQQEKDELESQVLVLQQEDSDKESIEKNFRYAIVDGEAHIIEYIGNDTDVVIPDEIEGCKVVSLGISAFMGELITRIEMSNNIIQIGDACFASCKNLKTIVVSNNLSEISLQAFDGCSQLQQINIPDGVTSIKGGAFFGCKNLKILTLPESVNHIEYNSFSKCFNLTNIFFTGTEAKWKELTREDNAINYFSSPPIITYDYKQ